MDAEKKTVSWLERIEEIVAILEGSSIGELELSEADTDIIIRRTPGMVLVNAPTQAVNSGGVVDGRPMSSPRTPKSEGVAVIAPMTGVYYAAASPSSPPFANIGDIIQAGQVIALIESMKVFNEVQSEVAGRVVALVGKTGEVVQKGDVLIRIEPL